MVRKEISDQMNVTAAWAFVDSMLGVDYGYEVREGPLYCWTANEPYSKFSQSWRRPESTYLLALSHLGHY